MAARERYFVSRHADGAPSALVRIRLDPERTMAAWRLTPGELWQSYPSLLRLVLRDPDFVWDEIGADEAARIEVAMSSSPSPA